MIEVGAGSEDVEVEGGEKVQMYPYPASTHSPPGQPPVRQSSKGPVEVDVGAGFEVVEEVLPEDVGQAVMLMLIELFIVPV